MIIVLHGENQIASRQRFNQLKEQFTQKKWQITQLDGKNTDFNQLKLAAISQSLLGNDTVVFIEGYWTKKIKQKRLEIDLAGEIIFWEGKELPKTLLNSLPKKWRVEDFPLPKLVFKFLESLNPQKPEISLKILDQLLITEAAEMVLPLLAWHIRQLIWASSSPQTFNLPPWRKNKLLFQAKNFQIEQLETLHQSLLKLDRNSKTGASVLPLKPILELALLNV
ncbi:hypothetical protein HY404_00285 [Candidatus Microgenomates bacterium]|nr:hypothetical protein [Candidatus Microgenomates bacterium]